ncbi:MAG: UDP-N-acetylmuramate dehydrogenase [Bacteroidia bacterium]
MQIQENISLKRFNTFGIDVTTRYYAEVRTVPELQLLLRNEKYRAVPKLILGGGSNLLFTKDYEGLVIRNCLEGIEKLKEDEEYVWIKAMSGEVWHSFVIYCIERGWGGIENLSLIPGTVGAAPMQNIGAYGVELRQTFEQLEAVRLEDGRLEIFDAESCRFGYRDSIFKNKAKGQYFIVSVSLRLAKKPEFNISYGAISRTLEEMGVKELTLSAVSEAVCSIRRSKLPDPAVLGNSGSFFKNPEIPDDQFNELKKKFPDIAGYAVGEGKTKVPAGWLIEQAGWKGKRIGETGAHKDQALVLVNYGNATGEEIWQLARQIQRSVQEKFGIELQPEVNVV